MLILRLPSVSSLCNFVVGFLTRGVFFLAVKADFEDSSHTSSEPVWTVSVTQPDFHIYLVDNFDLLLVTVGRKYRSG